MRYVMKQKLFSWGDDYVIKNENGEDAFSSMAKLSVLAANCHFTT